jgi:hypothetical protein
LDLCSEPAVSRRAICEPDKYHVTRLNHLGRLLGVIARPRYASNAVIIANVPI